MSIIKLVSLENYRLGHFGKGRIRIVGTLGVVLGGRKNYQFRSDFGILTDRKYHNCLNGGLNLIP